jgi:hypothetical protein
MRTDRLFTIRVPSKGGDIVITAFDAHSTSGYHKRIDIEVRHGGEVILARGDTYCSTPRSIDGIEARELVMSCVAMKPGDTDSEYFESYTPRQLAWVTEHGEDLDCIKQDRYCDYETGEHLPEGYINRGRLLKLDNGTA